MDTWRRILVTTDVSIDARKGYACAASLAEKFGAEIDLVHFAHLCIPKTPFTWPYKELRHLGKLAICVRITGCQSSEDLNLGTLRRP